jgi:hypothetical protein
MKYQFILKLADEFEARLKEQMEKEQALSFEEAYLLSVGAIPVDIGSGNEKGISHLGKGMFSTVYKVIYNGIPAVAKVTYSKEDIEALDKLNAIKNSLPSDLQKHILNIHKIIYADNSLIFNKFKSLSIKERGFKQPTILPHVAIVEELEPLSTDILKSIFQYESDHEKIKKVDDQLYINLVKKIKTDDQFLKSLVRSMLLSNKDVYKEFLFKKENFLILLNKISELLYNYKFPNQYVDFKNKLPIITEAISEIIKIILKYQKVENTILINEYAQDCSQEFYSFFWNLDTGLFPKNYESLDTPLKMGVLENYPEVKSLIKLLKILKNKYNISFRDLHKSNLMQRSNKDIVISDPGLFEFG